MSTPSAAFLLACPTCGKKYKGNPEKPNARYKCPADQSELVRPETAAPVPAPAPVATNDYEATQRIPSSTPDYETTQRISAPSQDDLLTQGFDYQATQKIEIDTSYESTQKIDIPAQDYEATQKIAQQPDDSQDASTQRFTQDVDDEQATRVLTSDTSASASDDQATRVMGSGEPSQKTPTPTPTPTLRSTQVS